MPNLTPACFVKTCKDRISKKQQLPNPKTNLTKFKKWLLLGGREDLLKRNLQEVHKSHRICKSHFSPANFSPNCDKLRETACPDTNIPYISATVKEKIEEGVPIDMPLTYHSHNFGESEDWGNTSPGNINVSRTLYMDYLEEEPKVSSHSVSGNCEDGDCSILDNLQDFMSSTETRTDHSPQVTADHMPHQDVDDLNASTSHPDFGYVSRLTASYVAGYVLNKVGVDCVNCISKQLELGQNDDHELISRKERSERRRLNYSSSSFTEIFRRTDDLLAQLIPKYCHISGIAQMLWSHVINDINFSGTACDVHIELFKNKFINYMVDLSLKFWSTRINRYLVGKANRLPQNSDAIQLKAIEYYKKKKRK